MSNESAKEKWNFENAMENFLAFIHMLYVEVKNLGGTWAAIHRLATKDGLETVRKIAVIVVEDSKAVAEEAEKAAIGIVRILKALNPAKFIGGRWKFGEEPGDRVEAPKEFDSKMVKLLSVLKDGESSVGGEERRKRLVALPGKRLGADAFLWFWEHKDQIPEEWKGKVVTFDSDVLVRPNGYRHVLSLYWYGDAWNWDALWLVDEFAAQFVSASLD